MIDGVHAFEVTWAQFELFMHQSTLAIVLATLVPLLLRQDITPWSCFSFSFFAQIWHQFVLMVLWTKSRRMFEFSQCKQNWHCSVFYVLYNCLFKNPNNLTFNIGSFKCWARSLINLHMNLYGLN